MAIKNKEELLNSIRQHLGDDVSDETLGFIEDVTDTLNDLSSKASAEQGWEQKYRDNDKMWREKYRNRFFNSTNNESDNNDENEEDITGEKPLKFENLFKEE